MVSSRFNITLPTESEMRDFAAHLAACIEGGAIIYLYGSLGAGKTTFARGFLRALGYNDKVKSPTFSLVEMYDFDERTIFHFDLYRLEDPRELKDIGIEEYFIPNAICLIEWPEKGMPFLPEPDLACHIDFANEGRAIILEAYTIRGETIIKKL